VGPKNGPEHLDGEVENRRGGGWGREDSPDGTRRFGYWTSRKKSGEEKQTGFKSESQDRGKGFFAGRGETPKKEKKSYVRATMGEKRRKKKNRFG